MDKSVLIVGGGLGGLFLGAILAHEGVKVRVLEKNATIGGGLQSFKRFGVSFDTGMHVIAGMQDGGNIRRLCQYLGISDEVSLKATDAECSDYLYFAEDKSYYRISTGKEAFVEQLAKAFPDEKQNLQNYVDAIYRMTEEIPLFNLQPSTSDIPVHSEDFMMAADAFIARYIGNSKLRSVLAYMNPLYGGRRDETPAYVHAIVNVLYINGTSRFAGGSHKFAELLAKVIEKNGGEIVVADEVNKVVMQDKLVSYVETKKGRRYEADNYVSAIHPCSLLRITEGIGLPKSFRTRMDEAPNSYSAFSLYIKLKPKSFPYINHTEYYMSRYDEIWNFGDKTKSWPLGFLLMTPPDVSDDSQQWARTVLVTAPMTFDEVKAWENTSYGNRCEDYENWKKEKTKTLLNMVEEIHPDFRNNIDKINSSSPLTIRDFYNVKDGAMCGLSKDYKNLALSQLPVVTKVRNLFLTGQNNNLHGFCGVALTSIQTAEAILGRNFITNRLNEYFIENK